MRLHLLLWLTILAGLACSAPPAPPAPNERPVARAGGDRTVEIRQRVTLDGSQSTDPEQEPLTYAWLAVESNPAQVTIPPGQVSFSFTPTVAGVYAFVLTVSDGQLSSRPDTLAVTVTPEGNGAPQAVVVSDFSIYPYGAPIILDAINSTDPDGDALTYRWRLDHAPAGASTAIEDSTARQTTLSADTPGDYVLVLEVSDGQLTGSTEFTVRVQAPDNLPPDAVVVAPTAARVNEPVRLSGTTSTDADGDSLIFRWTVQLPSGLHAELADSTGSEIEFTPRNTGEHVVVLEVRDGRGGSTRARHTLISDAAVYDEIAGMIQIPGTTFTMGTADGFGDDQPPHAVRLDTFWLDKYEVTAAQYQDCVDAGACTRAGLTLGCTAERPDRADHPINCVNWDQARAYCAWASRRLPTEAEWELAARGTDGRRFPWGDEAPGTDRLNYFNSGYESTQPVGTYPLGVSFYGVHNMGGNVHEWCSDYYDSDYYGSSPEHNPQGPESGNSRVARGASYKIGLDIKALSATTRVNAVSGTSLPELGFRCARTLPPQQ